MSFHRRTSSSLLLLSLLARPAISQETIRVVSYNIRMCKGQEEVSTPRVEVKLPFGFRLRVPSIPIPLPRPGQLGRIADRLESLDADVICLQEVNDRSLQTLARDQAAELGERLGMKYVYSVAHGEGRDLVKRQGNAVYSRHPILGHLIVELSPASGKNERRIAVFARIALPGYPEGVWVASLHAESNSEEVRLASMERLLVTLGGLKGPVILAGDFNARPDSAPVETLHRRSAEMDRPFTDAFAAAGEGPGETSSAPIGRQRIDYILATSELTPDRAWSPRDLNESDHFAVVADLSTGAREDETLAAGGNRGMNILGIPSE